jgi:flavoprotein
MALDTCRTHPGVTSAQVCRVCGEAWCAECLVEADELVLPLCRPCGEAAPQVVVHAEGEETMRFSPRTVDGWVVLHEQAG